MLFLLFELLSLRSKWVGLDPFSYSDIGSCSKDQDLTTASNFSSFHFWSLKPRLKYRLCCLHITSLHLSRFTLEKVNFFFLLLSLFDSIKSFQNLTQPCCNSAFVICAEYWFWRHLAQVTENSAHAFHAVPLFGLHILIGSPPCFSPQKGILSL